MRNRDKNKELLIRHKAMEMIVKHGFDGLSMQKLAKAANVSPATIYIYFKDREDLIEQLALSEVENMVSASFVDFKPSMPFAKGLKIQWRNRANYWIKHPLRAQFMEQIRHSPVAAKMHKKAKQEFSVIMREFVHNSILRGEIVKLPVEVYWAIAYAPLYQLIKFHNDGRGLHQEKFVLEEKMLDKALKLVIKALKP